MERVLVRRECDEGVVAAASSISDVHAHFMVSSIFLGLAFSWIGVVLFIVGQDASDDDEDASDRRQPLQ